jgi:hypothetical protein
MLSPMHEYLVPRYSASAFVQPLIEVARARAIFATRLGRVPTIHLPGFEEAVRAHPELEFPEAAYLARTMVYVEAFAELFRPMLERLQPRVVYVVCYYGAERFAMQLAANRLGIPTVDLQHGYCGRLHWAYGQWPRPPKGGFEMLPRYYWLWSEEDRKTIDEWAAGSDEHRGLVGGNLFAHMWHDGKDDVVQRYDERVRSLLARHPGRAAVLYASNGLEGDEQLRALGRIIHETRGDLYWYPRAHPCRMGEGDRLERLLREGGATDFDRDNATALPLYALFRHMDLHVTETSTTVMEAASFGVPTVLWGHLEAAMFPAYTASGMALPAAPADVPNALRAQLAARARLRDLHRPKAPADLDRLLALASPKSAATC